MVGLSSCETGFRLVPDFSSTVRVSFGHNDRRLGEGDNRWGCQRRFWLHRGDNATRRAHVDGVIFMALCASASNNKRVGGHCRNIGRAFWHLPRRLRNISFARVCMQACVYLTAGFQVPQVALQVPRQTSPSEWTKLSTSGGRGGGSSVSAKFIVGK